MKQVNGEMHRLKEEFRDIFEEEKSCFETR
jgi:hypothetical protein